MVLKYFSRLTTNETKLKFTPVAVYVIYDNAKFNL